MDKQKRPIVIKRVKKIVGGGHGAAWKIAYADFVTAMMAFFLLMWLLGSTTKGNLQGIAEYFQTPLKVALQGGEGSGDSASLIKGGGKDMTAATGQLKKSDVQNSRKSYSLKDADGTLALTDKARLHALKKNIESVLDRHPKLKQYRKQILLDMVNEGLRIQLMDAQNRPMFASAQAELEPYTRDLLREIAAALNEVPNRISLSGHTDATPYSDDDKSYSNWELSADRANASRRELISAGMDQSKVLRVVGLASEVLWDSKRPFDPINRRISIIVLNKKTEQAIMQDDANVEDIEPEELKKTETKAEAGAVPQPVVVPGNAANRPS